MGPAPLTRPGLTAWIITDGKVGDEAPCLALVEALGLAAEARRVRPRAPFAWAMPYGPIDPAERPGRPASPIRPPFPDLLVASGRRSVPYVRAAKRASGGRVFTVILKDPRTGPKAADVVWVPEHDRLRGPNVLATPLAPHRLTAERLAAARHEPDPRLARLARPRVAVLAGGDSRHHRFTPDDIDRFASGLAALAADGASLAITASRRTPPRLRAALEALASGAPHWMWDGTGPNPYVQLLAGADAVVATADSTNMVGEAAATGRPILLFEPSGGHPKIRAFLDGLRRHGAVHSFAGRLEGAVYEPLDNTMEIAGAVAAALERHLSGLPPVAAERPER